MRLFPVPARTNALELLDLPGIETRLLIENLADLRAVNRWLGGTWMILRALQRVTRDLPAGAPIRILDLATGSADVPQAILAWAAQRGLNVQVFATDKSSQILQIGRARGVDAAFAALDGCHLPFPDRSFEIVMCSLALHHLEPPAAVRMLAEMRRTAHHAVIVNDLVRHWPTYWVAALLGRLFSRNPLTRHDGPLSVLRAYTTAEMRALAEAALLVPVRFEHLPGYRVTMIYLKGGRQ